MKKNKILLYIFLLVLISLVPILSSRSLAWNNGSPGEVYYGVKYGGHDWIAHKANTFLPAVNQTWLNIYFTIYLMGTEAPDNSGLSYNSLSGYGDTSLHNANYTVGSENTNAPTRAQQEYDKALDALQHGKYDEGAWYAGAMTHYIADLAVWGHVLDNESVHSNYESSANNKMDTPLESYFQVTFDGSYDGITAFSASYEVGNETWHGDSSYQYNAYWMDNNYHAFDGDHPDDAFEQRGEYLLGLAVNKITDMLYNLSAYYNSTILTAPPPIPSFEIIITMFTLTFMIGIIIVKRKMSIKEFK